MDILQLIIGDTAILIAVVSFGYRAYVNKVNKIKELEDQVTKMEIERVQLKSTIEMLENKYECK